MFTYSLMPFISLLLIMMMLLFMMSPTQKVLGLIFSIISLCYYIFSINHMILALYILLIHAGALGVLWALLIHSDMEEEMMPKKQLSNSPFLFLFWAMFNASCILFILGENNLTFFTFNILSLGYNFYVENTVIMLSLAVCIILALFSVLD